MAAHLTDRQKKKIIADYVQLGSYNATAKMNGVSLNTVKNIVKGNADVAQKCKQKKEQNTADIISYMESQRNDVCTVLGICLAALKNPDKYAKSTPREIATTMAILIDKYTANSGDNITGAQSEDALSKSFREIGEELESDE